MESFVGESARVHVQSVQSLNETHLSELLLHCLLLGLFLANLTRSLLQDLSQRVLAIQLANLGQIVHHCILQKQTNLWYSLFLVLSELDVVCSSSGELLL